MKKPLSLSLKFPSPVSSDYSLENVVLTWSNTLDIYLTWRKEIYSGNRLVSNGHQSFDCVYVYSRKVAEVLEDCAIGSSNSELNLR